MFKRFGILPAHFVLFPRVQIQVKYHLLSLFFVCHCLRRHPCQGLRGWRIKLRPSVVLNRSSQLVIVHNHLFRSIPFFSLLGNVGDWINVQHDAERLWFSFLRVITRIGHGIFVHGFHRRRFVITRRPSVGIVIVPVKTHR